MIENYADESFRLKTAEACELFWRLMDESEALFHFSSKGRFFCQFYFDGSNLCEDGSGQFSNSVLIPGGTIKLFKRSLPLGTVSDSPTCTALGISFESSEIWIVRVAAITGSRRVEIKAGATRADVLRVPNTGKGSWSDLLPIERGFCDLRPEIEKTIFLIEFI